MLYPGPMNEKTVLGPITIYTCELVFDDVLVLIRKCR